MLKVAICDPEVVRESLTSIIDGNRGSMSIAATIMMAMKVVKVVEIVDVLQVSMNLMKFATI